MAASVKILESDGNIFSINADGSGKTYLTNDGATASDALAAWSYDGTKIVYTRAATDQPPYLWSMNADGSHKQQLTTGPLTATAATYSPDGSSILFSTTAGSPGSSQLVGGELWVMNADGSNAHPLTHTTVGTVSPDGSAIKWSIFGSYNAGGTKIAYASTQSGDSEIWLMNSDGSGQQQLTFASQDGLSPEANAPSWSPDGSKIAFAGGVVGPGGESDIFTVNADGTNRKELTFGGVSDDPIWSPDGTQIYYQTTDNYIWVMNADGSNQQLLFHGSWSSSVRPLLQTGSQPGAATSLTEQAKTSPASGTDGAGEIVTAANGDATLSAATPAAGTATNFDFSGVAFGSDTIVGFDPARDTIALKSGVAADFAAVQADLSATAAGTLITLGPGLTITVQGVGPDALGAANFRFV